MISEIINKIKSSDMKKVCIAMNIRDDGCSDWISLETLEEKLPELKGQIITSNGSKFFQKDRGLGTYFVVEKDRIGKKSIQKVRTRGYVSAYERNRQFSISKDARKKHQNQDCVICCTGSKILIDHKDGTKEPNNNTTVDDYQPLCDHCNAVKREVCKKCQITKKRFDAKRLGFTQSFIDGDENFYPSTIRCIGCYWYDPIKFRNSFIKIQICTVEDILNGKLPQIPQSQEIIKQKKSLFE